MLMTAAISEVKLLYPEICCLPWKPFRSDTISAGTQRQCGIFNILQPQKIEFRTPDLCSFVEIIVFEINPMDLGNGLSLMCSSKDINFGFVIANKYSHEAC